MSEGTASESTTPSLVGQVLDGRYRLTKKLGEGGMGEVYAAEHMHIEKRFAIKLLRPEIVSNQEAVKRFYQEARSSSSIGHRNIIGIEDFGTLSDGRVYMCMELLNGAPLNDMLQHPMPVDRLLNILIQTGHGLAAAHAKGIVHRDMKPENIYVTVGPNGEDIPKLLDFGIAKVSGNDGQNHLTRTGTIFGTPFYMAPEQALGNTVDQRTDIYAMGVIMYEVFAGSLPFQGESFMGILTQHITTDPEPVSQRAAKAGRQLDPQLADIVTKCTRKNPAERYNTMDELVADLVQVYRRIAGAGMSTYMEAFPHAASATGQGRAPTGMSGPQMMQGGNSGQQQVPSGMSATAMPGMPPPGAQSGMQRAMGSQPVPAVSPDSSGLYNPSSVSIREEPKKGGGKGILIAIIALLVVGGGVTAAVLVMGGDKSNGAGSGSGSGSDPAVVTTVGSGSQVAIGDPKNPKGSDVKPLDPKNSGSDKPNGTDPTGSNGSAGSAGSATVVEPKVTVDAGTDDPKPTIDAAPAAPDTKEVILSARNVASFEVWDNSGKLGDGPMNLDVPANGKRTVTIKAKGFKDRQMVVDAKQKSVQFSMDRIAAPPPPPPPHDGSNTRPPPPPPPPSVNCSNVIVDPKSAACVKQYCALHKSDLRCEAE